MKEVNEVIQKVSGNVPIHRNYTNNIATWTQKHRVIEISAYIMFYMVFPHKNDAQSTGALPFMFIYTLVLVVICLPD